MNDKKFYNMKIYSKPKINYNNGYNAFNFKHYNKKPKINNNDLDGCYAIFYEYNVCKLIHITTSILTINNNAFTWFRTKSVKWKKGDITIFIDFREKYSYRLNYSTYIENTNKFLYQNNYTFLRDIKILLPKKTTKEQAILLYKIYLNDIKKENE